MKPKDYIDITYTEPEITKGEETPIPDTSLTVPRVSPNHPFYRHHDTIFNLENYLYVNPPIDLGLEDFDLKVFSQQPKILRLTIKQPNTGIRLPKEIPDCISYWVNQNVKYEAGFNKNIENTFMHLTIDDAQHDNTTQRLPGFHVDGFQGAKLRDETRYDIIEHSYILASDPGTQICAQPFYLQHLEAARHNSFFEMDKQAKPENIRSLLGWHTYLIDPYMIHRTPPALTGRRIFMRLTVCYQELENPNNTQNPSFSKNNYPERHDIRQFLKPSDIPIPWEMYGLSK